MHLAWKIPVYSQVPSRIQTMGIQNVLTKSIFITWLTYQENEHTLHPKFKALYAFKDTCKICYDILDNTHETFITDFTGELFYPHTLGKTNSRTTL